MLLQTKRWVEKLKEIGFQRNEFSCRTPQDSKKQGWDYTKIRFDTSQIAENLGVRKEEDDEKVQKAVRDYVRDKGQELVDAGLTIIEQGIGDRYIHFSVWTNKKPEYSVFTGTFTKHQLEDTVIEVADKEVLFTPQKKEDE